MAHTISWLLLLLQFLGSITFGLGCFCDRYPWNSWSACSRTCNYGIQLRKRTVQYDSYYWKSSCLQLCNSVEIRACNPAACPINCQLTDFGPWSECSPCAKLQLRTRFVQTPSQFGGAGCSEELTETRPCHPSTLCKIPPVNCRDDFQCDNGRCINATLTCNRQNDCGDNSDERNCDELKVVCPAEKRVAPGADLVGNGFDAMAEEPRGAVLDNMFMGGSCNLRRPRGSLLYHRIPHNFESFEIKVGVPDDFNVEKPPVKAERVNMQSSISTSSGQPAPIPFLQKYLGRSAYKEALQALKTKESQFFRVHQLLPVSTYKLRDPTDLVLSGPFLEFLHALPLDYNYALYRDIFQRFGTHYYSSGTLGGHYDLLYQFSREAIRTSGETTEHIAGCLGQETMWTMVLYTKHSDVTQCQSNQMTQKYQGSIIQASEKSFSMVRGGRAREAAGLAWERTGPVPNKESYKNWAKSVIDNPAVVDYELLPIIDLVRGIPCARTKRRHLRKALIQYLEEFDSCKCAPCPNNARAVLSGTECKCICQEGTYGPNCEHRAQDYTSEGVDGYWSCWGPWSGCGAAMRRQRTRSCDNPAPIRRGQPCKGAAKEEESCHISLFQRQDTCDNDDDFTVGLRDTLPPGVEGCLRPQRPVNSFLVKAKLYYDHGEVEEFECFTGFELEGFSFINCLPDGTWTQPKGSCLRKVCLPLEVPNGMSLYPKRAEYRMGQSVGLNCLEPGLAPLPRLFYRCANDLTWDPPLPADLRCTDENPFVPDTRCGPGRRQGSAGCECVERQSCLSKKDGLCALNVDLDVAVPMSLCLFYAGRCHGDPLVFISEGPCEEVDPAVLEWAKFRGKMASKSLAQEPCGLDTCYEWETCTESKCVCKAPRDCPRSTEQMFCVKLTRNQSLRAMNLCSMAALKCINYEFEILNEGQCASR